MEIVTEYGVFGSFKDLKIYMITEKRNTVKIDKVVYWGVLLGFNGVYSIKDIEFILTAN